MAILSTIKKVIPYIKTATGYVLCRLSSQAVQMDDGSTLQESFDSLNSKLTQNVTGKFVVPGGLKIFWGTGKCSSSADPSGVYSVEIIFPEAFSSDKYAFLPVRFNNSSDGNKAQPAFGYYQKMKEYIYVGNSFGPITFDWIAIGY